MRVLHITNGDMLTERMQDLSFEGDILTWREMLCEGPTASDVLSHEFNSKRSAFLEAAYDIPKGHYQDKFVKTLEDLDDLSNYDCVYLWFEFDLFCHINLIAAISWLRQRGYRNTMLLVCSGRVKGEDGLKGLSELTNGQLKSHFENAITLLKTDIQLAQELWEIYNSANHAIFKEYVSKPSSFPYLSNCLSAHLKRFPSTHNGLNLLETHILNLIHQHRVKSAHHLTGYALQYQGYYGFGDSQIKHIINRLKPFFKEEDDELILNEEGQAALEKKANYIHLMEDESYYGGARKYDYRYEITSRKILPA